MEIPFPPQCRSRYRPEKLLASGGFGSVYLATQVNLDRSVAVKLLKSDILQDPEQVERFLAEAKITAALSHQNVVMILDHAVEDGVPWIAYEFLPGRSVRALVDAGPLAPREALAIVGQVAGALARAHAQSILHRDIKPENVLEVEPGYYKVTDFGIAKWTREGAVKTKTGMLLGTPAYMAPEQIRGAPPAPAADQYALGVMLFELLTGAPPFVDANPVKVLMAHVEQLPPAPSELRPGLPGEVDVLCAKVLDKEPARRFASCLELKAAVEELACLFPAGRTVGVRSGVIRRGPAQDTAAALVQVTAAGQVTAPVARPLAAAQDTAPVSRPPKSGAVTAETPRAAASGVTPRPSRKITSTLSTATPVPARDRSVLQAGGALAAVALAVGAGLASRIVPAVPSPAATISAPPSVAASRPSVAVSGSPVAASTPPEPPSLPAELVSTGAENAKVVLSKMQGTFKFLEETKGVAPRAIWNNLQLLQQNYYGVERVEDDFFDEGLARYEPTHEREVHYWFSAAEWRASKYNRIESPGAWARAAHDYMMVLATIRQPLRDTKGEPNRPHEDHAGIAPASTKLRMRGHHWRSPEGERLMTLEWRLRVPLHGLASYGGLFWQRTGGTMEQVSLAASQMLSRICQETILDQRKCDKEFKGAFSRPPEADRNLPAAWLEQLNHVSKPARRAYLARAVAGCLADKMREKAGYPLAVSASDPMRALLKLLIREEEPRLVETDGLTRLATEPAAHHPVVLRSQPSDPGSIACTKRLEAATLAGLLVDWLHASLRAAPAAAGARGLAVALIEALEWRLALAAGTAHEHLRDEAIQELEESLPSLSALIEPSDSKRALALIETVKSRSKAPAAPGGSAPEAGKR